MAKQLNLETYKPNKEVMELSNQLEKVIGHNPIGFAFELANKVSAVAQWIEHPEIQKIVAKLEGSSQGFVTDLSNDGKFYAPKVRNAAVLDALTSGVRLNGNEFNIIAGKMMIVQNGWRRLCQEMGHKVPGGYSPNCQYEMVRMDCHETGEPEVKGNMVTIPMEITYEWIVKKTGDVVEGSFKKNITITTKSRDTVDAWIGKAERRILRAFFRLHSGAKVVDDDTAGEFTGDDEGKPPLGSTQKSSKPKAAKAEPKAQPAPPTGQPADERPNVAQDVEYKDVPKEPTPAMDETLQGMVSQGVQTAPPEQEEPPMEVPPQEVNSNRPTTNF